MTDRKLALCGAATLFAVYLANGRVQIVSPDTDANVHLAAALVERGVLGLSPSRAPALFALPEWRRGLLRTPRVDATTGEALSVTMYGPGTAIAAAPVFAALRPFRLDPYLVGKISAALCAAAAAALLYLAARRWVARSPAALLAFAFAFGTPTWSSSSQGLWQHAPTTFFLVLGIFLFVRGGAASIAGAGAALTAAAACRPTMAVFAAAIALHLVMLNRRGALALALGALPIAAALAAHNLYWLGSPLRSGQASLAGGAVDVWSTPLLEGLAGILVSPSRGLFVFSPFLLAAIPGAVLAWRRAEYRELRPLAVAVLAALLIHAKWCMWWGGHSYSYRIIADLAGPLVLLSIPFLAWIAAQRARLTAFVALVTWAVLVHAVGIAVSGGSWSTKPNIDDARNRGRLWSVTRGPIPYEFWDAGGKRVAQLFGFAPASASSRATVPRP